MKPLRILLLFPLLLCSCSLFFPPQPAVPLNTSSVKGAAVIVEIHPEMHYVLMKTEYGTLKGWWDESSKFYYGPSQVQSLTIKPGDTVRYQGIYDIGEIYIRLLVQPH